MTTGERIQSLRKTKGYSQEKLASYLNVTRQAVQKWEQNVCEPSLDSLVSIANLFEVSLDYLITGKENEVKEEMTEDKKETTHNKTLNKVDIILLITLILSVLLFFGLFIYSLRHPISYLQSSYSFIWWYILIWESYGIFFRILNLLSIIGIVTSLVFFLENRKM